MIKIDKNKNIPKSLAEDGIEESNNLMSLFEKDPDKFTSKASKKNSDVKKFPFENKIYRDVKEQLETDQQKKCCYCEAIFNANGYGDVEHFRPKAAYKIDEKLKYPGYYWLVYDWNNLMYSCRICNNIKGNEFPLIDEDNRVENHLSKNKIINEQPILINPITEDPEDFITFNGKVPKPKNNLSKQAKLRAKETIRIFGIDRKNLNTDRLVYLNQLATDKFFSEIKFDINNQIHCELLKNLFPNTQIHELEKQIRVTKDRYSNAAKQTSKFSAMVRSNFPELSTF